MNDTERYFKKLNEVDVPNHLSEARQKGIVKFQKQRRRKKRFVAGTISVATILFVFIFSIRMSPAFAQVVAQIPGMETLVQLVQNDKGFVDIAEEQYYEEIGVSQTKGDYTLTIDWVIADESGMVIAYELKSEKDISNKYLNNFDVLHGDKPIQASIYINHAHQEAPIKSMKETIGVVAVDNIDYSVREFAVKGGITGEEDITFHVPFTLKQEVMQSKKYEVNKEVEIDGQRFTVQWVKLSPLRAEVRLSINKANTYALLDFSNMQLTDERGEQWGQITNGITGMGTTEDNEFSLFLESNYFRTPEKLTLNFEKIEAVRKEDQLIEVDFENKKVKKSPNIHMDIQILDNYTIEYSYEAYLPNSVFGLFGKVIDEDGKEIYSGSTMIGNHNGRVEVTQLYPEAENLKNPVKIQITRYGNYLNGSASVEIDLK